jgi:quinol monooxygenase YgiN
MPIYKTARFQVKSQSIEKCKAAIREFVTYVQNNEPGTLLYTAQQEVEDPTQFMHFFIFTDAEAEETHRTSDAVKHFTGILYPETVDGVVFTDYTLVASTDN